MKDLLLSPHFKLSEFERSATATRLGIDNSVPSQYIPALQQLCKEILEPLREFAGQPIIISSGYRCPQLNIKVGGVYSSQHTLGEACDIRIPDNRTGRQWFLWMMDNLHFDKLIFEHSHGIYWIHVSFKRNRTRNRQQVIHNLQKK